MKMAKLRGRIRTIIEYCSSGAALGVVSEPKQRLDLTGGFFLRRLALTA